MTNYTKLRTHWLVLTVCTLFLLSAPGCKDEECNQPTNLTVSNVTGSTAQLNWTAADPAPNAYDWQVVPSGNQPGTGTVVSGTATALSAQATGLSATTNYDFYVRSSCDDDVSGWAGPGAFTTTAGGAEPPIYLCDTFPNTITEDYTLVDNPNAPVDYVIECNIRVGANLNINPGVVIEMGADAGMYTITNGSIKAAGTSTDHITFRGTASQKGHWRGIAVTTPSLLNEFSYVDISDASGLNVTQGGPYTSFLLTTDGILKFNNNTISNGLHYGYYQTATADVNNWANNSITTHDEYPVYIHADDLGQLDGTGSTYTGNGMDMIRMAISPGSVITVTTGQTWENPGVPVIVDDGTLGIRADLEIEPGFEMVCRQDVYINVHNTGSLNAEGTASQPIIIRGEQSQQGYWTGINVEGSSTLNTWDHVEISDGGREKVFGAAAAKANVYVSSTTTNFSISNSTISNSLECGIYTSNAGVTLTNNTYSNNAVNDVCP